MKGKFFGKRRIGFAGILAVIAVILITIITSTFSSKTTNTKTAETRTNKAMQYNYPITGDDLAEAAIQLMLDRNGYGLDCSGFVAEAMKKAGYTNVIAYSPMTWNSEWVEFSMGGQTYKPTLIGSGYSKSTKWFAKTNPTPIDSVPVGTIVSGTADPQGRGNGHVFIYLGKYDTVAELKQAMLDKYGKNVEGFINYDAYGNSPYWYIEGNGSSKLIRIRNYGWQPTDQGAKNLTYTKLWKITAEPSGEYGFNIAKKDKSNPNGNSLAGAEFKISQQINDSAEINYYSGINEKSSDNNNRFVTGEADSTIVEDNIEISANDIGQYDFYKISETNPPAGYAMGGNGTWTVALKAYKDYIGEPSEGNLGINKLELMANTTGDYNGYIINVGEDAWFDESLNHTSNPENAVLHIELDSNGTNIYFTWLDPKQEGNYDVDLVKIDKETGSVIGDTEFEITQQIGENGTVKKLYNYQYYDYNEDDEYGLIEKWRTVYTPSTKITRSEVISEEGVDTYTIKEVAPVSGYSRIGGRDPLVLKVYKHKNAALQFEVEKLVVAGKEIGRNGYVLLDDNLQSGEDVTEDNYAVKVSLSNDKTRIVTTWRNQPLTGSYNVYMGKKSSEDIDGAYISDMEYNVEQYLDIMNVEDSEYNYETGEVERYIRRDIRYASLLNPVVTENAKINVIHEITKDGLHPADSQEILYVEDTTGEKSIDTYVFAEEDNTAMGYEKNNVRVMVRVYKKVTDDLKGYELDYLTYEVNHIDGSYEEYRIDKGQKLWVLADQVGKLDSEVTEDEKKNATGYIEFNQDGGDFTFVGIDKPLKGKYDVDIKKVNASNSNSPIAGIKFKINSDVANCLDDQNITAETDTNGKTKVAEDIEITKDNVDDVDSYTITEVITNNENLVKLKEPLTFLVYKDVNTEKNAYIPSKVAFDAGDTADSANTTIEKTVELENGREATARIFLNGYTVVVEIPNAVSGKYKLNIGKKSLEKISDDNNQSFVAGAKFNITQFIDSLGHESQEVSDDVADVTSIANSAAEIKFNGNNEVVINSTARNDRYEIRETETPFNLIKNDGVFEVEIVKAYDAENLKLYVSDISLRGPNGEQAQTKTESGNIAKYELKDENEQVIFVAMLDKSTDTITFVYGNEAKKGNYDFVVTKTDYEKQIIESEKTKFDVKVYSDIETRQDKVNLDEANRVTLVNEYNTEITTTDLTAITGKTTGMNGIKIKDEDIGKTYYFVVEETVAPDKYTAIDYLVVVPVSFEAKSDKYEAKAGEAFALIKTETSGEYTRKDLSELKTDDNEVASLDDMVGVTINLNVPDKQIEGMYDVVLTKTDYEDQIIQDERTTFDVSVFGSKEENGNEVTFSNQVDLYKTTDKNPEDKIDTYGLTTVTGKTTGLNGIAIQPDDIGKTYFFIVEESMAPDKYTAIDYLVAIPVTYTVENDEFVANKGDIFGLIKTDTPNKYTKKSMSELESEYSKVAKLDDGIAIDLKVPNKRITGDYKIKIRKVDSVTNNPIDGVTFTGTRRNDEQYSVTTGHVDGQNGVAVIADEHIEDHVNTTYTVEEISLPSSISSEYLQISDFMLFIDVTTKLSDDGKKYVIDNVSVAPEKINTSSTTERQRELVNKINKSIDNENQVITITIPNEQLKDYKFKLKKFDMENNPLTGAEFTIYEDGEVILGTSKTEGAPLDNVGEFLVERNSQLINTRHVYKIYETKAPTGFENIFEKLYAELTININSVGNVSANCNILYDSEKGGNITDLVAFNQRMAIENPNLEFLTQNNDGTYQVNIPNPKGDTDLLFTLTKHEKNSTNGVEGAVFNTGKIKIERGESEDLDEILASFDHNQVDAAGIITTTISHSKDLVIDSQDKMSIGDTYYYQITESIVPNNYTSKFKKAVVRIHANNDQSISAEIVAVKLTEDSAWDKNFSSDEALVLSQNENVVNLSWENNTEVTINVIKRKYNNQEFQNVNGNLTSLDTLSGAAFTVKRVHPETKEQIGDIIYDNQVMEDTFSIENTEVHAGETLCYELVENNSVEGYTNIFQGVKIYVYLIVDDRGLIDSTNSRIELVGNIDKQTKKYLQDRCSLSIGRMGSNAEVNIANEQRTLSLELMKVDEMSINSQTEDLRGISGIEFGITKGESHTPIYGNPDAQTNPMTDDNGYIYVDEIAPQTGIIRYEFEEINVPQGVKKLDGVKITVAIDTNDLTNPEDITADDITIEVTKNGEPIDNLDVKATIVNTTIILQVPNKTTDMLFNLLKKNDEGTVVGGADFTVERVGVGIHDSLFSGKLLNGIFNHYRVIEPNLTYEFKVTENEPPTPYLNVLQGYDLYVHLETDSEGKIKGTEPSATGNSYIRLEQNGDEKLYDANTILNKFVTLVIEHTENNDNIRSTVTLSIIDPYSYKVQINKKNGNGRYPLKKAVITAEKVNDARPGTLFDSTEISRNPEVEKQELQRIVNSTDVSNETTLDRQATVTSEQVAILNNIGMAPTNESAQVWRIRETDVDKPYINILGNNTLIVQTMYKSEDISIINHHDLTAQGLVGFYVVTPEGDNVTGDYINYIDVELIEIDGVQTISVTVKDPGKIYIDLNKVKYDPETRNPSRLDPIEGAVLEMVDDETEEVVARIENGSSSSDSVEHLADFAMRAKYTISEISTPRGYVNIFENINIKVELGLDEHGTPASPEFSFTKADGTEITSQESAELEKYITFGYGNKDGYPLIHIFIENPEENPSSFNFELIKKDKDTNVRMNGVEFSLTVFDEDNNEVTLKDVNTAEEINTQSLFTRSVETANGTIDGVLSVPNILIEDEGTYTFVLHEKEITNSSVIYKSFAEDIKVKVKIVYEDGKYVIKSAQVVQGNQYVEFLNVSNGEQQTISSGVLNERVKGSYNVVIEKLDSYDTTRKLDGAKFEINVYDARGRATDLIDGSKDLRTRNAISLENLVTENGKIEINNIRIESPTTTTFKISEREAPAGYLRFKDLIELSVSTKVEGTDDDARFVLDNVSLVGDYGDKVTLDTENNTIYIRVKDEYFDLALRKSIELVQYTDGTEDGKITADDTADRVPEPDSTNIDKVVDEKLITTADYKHVKNHVRSFVGQEVIYTLRVYNEGEVDGYAEEVVDHLPEGLEFVNDSFNAEYGWHYVEGDATLRTVSTSKLSKEVDEEANLIKARNKVTGDLDCKEIKIKCRVKSDVTPGTILTNIAEITRRVAVGYSENETVDRDNTADAVIPDTNEGMSNYKENELTNDRNKYVPGQEDDDDFEKLIVDVFDLALRKYIVAVNDDEVLNTQGDDYKYDREPRVNADALKDRSDTTASYTHTKEPLEVAVGDIVTYTIEVFNEGSISGYASLVKDDIPEGLEFVPNHPINTKYEWTLVDESDNPVTDLSQAKYVVTDYLSKDKETAERQNLIESFENTLNQPHSKYVQVAFKVVCEEGYTKIITNEAQISDDSDKDGNAVKDRDSTPNKWLEEDDEDKEHVKVVYMDLALRKFITGVTDFKSGKTQEVTSRIPDVKTDKLDTVVDGKYITTAEYTHLKNPVLVHTNDVVIYTLRVYNEGVMDGYAAQIKDDLPEGLEFLPDHEINKEFEWYLVDANDNKVTDISKATYAVTNYRSKENETAQRQNLIAKFDKDTMNKPDYTFVKIAFKVIEPTTSDRILTNNAQISKQTDKKGNIRKDRDSTPNKWLEEDDEDKEHVRVLFFDLALRKWVTKSIVTVDGKTTVTNTGHKAEDDPEEVVKVDLKKSKVNSVVVKFEYQIRITNEGEIAGWADEVKDYIPEGLRFDPADNPTWKKTDDEKVVVTDELKGTLLQPGESAEVTIVLTWINSSDNMGVKVNIAEISKDRNDYNTKDIDSTPNNKVPKEDDIDDAPVMLTIKTGKQTAEYITIATAVITILALGVTLIKKYTSNNK